MTQKYKLLPEFKNHEQIVELNDLSSGLKGFIAIHNTVLGPALGGTRIFPYKNRAQALKDVLRLSRAMTYKCAIAGLKFGGGKGVIIADPKKSNIKKILRSYAEQVKNLKGKFYTGEDVGLSESDVQYMLKFCPYFIGKSHLAGDPSPYAALSAFLSLKRALKYKFGSDKIKGVTFAIKGVGKTGSELARLIYGEGGEIIISDVDKQKAKKLKKQLPKIKILPVSKIQKFECDVYVPCAMGDDINIATARKMRTKIICGTANNQLTNPVTAQILYERKILHVPDYISNAGGLIDVSAELWEGGYSKKKVFQAINNLMPVLDKVLLRSTKLNKNPDVVADMEAEENFIKSEYKMQIAMKAIKSLFKIS